MRYSKAYDEYTREPRTTTFNHEPRPLTAYHAARTILKSLPIAIRSTRAWASATTTHVAWPITITPTNYKDTHHVYRNILSLHAHRTTRRRLRPRPTPHES